ncbi:MAG: hypothetical protein J3R72DRAFT_35613 [Linnemannia gamsii]|nr:MAG: hypothetical protein J3R72DRAFT_35613 [Linnemannia gamsii]
MVQGQVGTDSTSPCTLNYTLKSNQSNQNKYPLDQIQCRLWPDQRLYLDRLTGKQGCDVNRRKKQKRTKEQGNTKEQKGRHSKTGTEAHIHDPSTGGLARHAVHPFFLPFFVPFPSSSTPSFLMTYCALPDALCLRTVGHRIPRQGLKLDRLPTDVNKQNGYSVDHMEWADLAGLDLFVRGRITMSWVLVNGPGADEVLTDDTLFVAVDETL